jgi:hypothetical protein
MVRQNKTVYSKVVSLLYCLKVKPQLTGKVAQGRMNQELDYHSSPRP